MTLPRTLAAGSAVLFFALSACGGSDEAPALTSDEFITQADKICADGDEAMAALEPAADASIEVQDKAFRDLADLLIEQADKIDKLVPPADIADDVDAMIDSLVEGANVIKDKGAAVMEMQSNPLEDATTKADALGLTVCGK